MEGRCLWFGILGAPPPAWEPFSLTVLLPALFSLLRALSLNGGEECSLLNVCSLMLKCAVFILLRMSLNLISRCGGVAAGEGHRERCFRTGGVAPPSTGTAAWGHSVEGPGMFKGTVKGLPCTTGHLPAVLGIQSSSGPRQLEECDRQTWAPFAPGSGEDSFNHRSSCSPEGRAPIMPKFP